MMKFPREFYIPKGSYKVAHKRSDAVAYISTNSKGKPRATVFYGEQSKPISDCWYSSEERREEHVAQLFAGRQAHQERQAAARAERKAFTHGVKLGDIYYTCWGYDQTNTEFFEVTKLIGAKMCEVRELQVASSNRGSIDAIAPQSGLYVQPRYAGDPRGLPMRKLIQQSGSRGTMIRIDDVRAAWPWGERVAGAVVGSAKTVTAAGWGH